MLLPSCPPVFTTSDETEGGKYQEGVGFNDLNTSRTDDEEDKQVCGRV